MKIRNGFVTNSSSSSFIVAFKSRDSVAKDLANESLVDSDNLKILLDRILPNGSDNIEDYISRYREMIEYITKWETEWKIEDEYHGDWQAARDWVNNHKDEFEARVQNEIDRQVSYLRSQLEGKEFISMITVSDHTHPDLEHNILPYLKCTLKQVSHH